MDKLKERKPVIIGALAVIAFLGGWSVVMGRIWGNFIILAAWAAYLVLDRLIENTEENPAPFHTPLLTSLMLLLAVYGAVLYLGSYFWELSSSSPLSSSSVSKNG